MSDSSRKRKRGADTGDDLGDAASHEQERDVEGAVCTHAHVTLADLPQTALASIVDSLGDRDYGACVRAARAFCFGCSPAQVRARRLSAALTKSQAIRLKRCAVPVLRYMAERRGVRFDLHDLARACKRGTLDTVRFLLERGDWAVDDEASIGRWLREGGLVRAAEALRADSAHFGVGWDAVLPDPTDFDDRIDQRGLLRVRVPLCLCRAMDAAAGRRRLDVMRLLDSVPGYGCTWWALLRVVRYYGYDTTCDHDDDDDDKDESDDDVDKGEMDDDGDGDGRACDDADRAMLDLIMRRCPGGSRVQDAVDDAVGDGRLDLALVLYQRYGVRCNAGIVTGLVGRRDYRSPTTRREWTDIDPSPDHPIVVGAYRFDASARPEFYNDKNDEHYDEAGSDAYIDRVLASGIVGQEEDVRRAADAGLTYAAVHGHAQTVAMLHERWGARFDHNYGGIASPDHDCDAITYAARANHIALLDYMMARGGRVRGRGAIIAAASTGALAAVRYMCEMHDAPWDHRAVERAARAGHARTVAYLCERDVARCRVGRVLVSLARAETRPDPDGDDDDENRVDPVVLSVLIEYATSEQLDVALRCAMGRTRTHLWRALHARGAIAHAKGSASADAGTSAAQDPPPDPGAARAAMLRDIRARLCDAIRECRADDVSCLLSIIAEAPRLAAKAMVGSNAQETAACSGDTEILRVLCAYGIAPAGASAMRLAVHNGNLGAVRVLHEHYGTSGPWVGLTMNSDVANTRMDVARYMDRHFGWRWWSARAVDKAAAKGNLAIVRFLHARRRPGEAWCTEAALDGAMAGQNWEVAAFLHAAGARCSPAGLAGADKPCGCLWVAPLIEAIAARCRADAP
jgi:hypothetical protein